VLRIDADLLGKQHGVAVLSDLSNKLPCPIELEQPRTAVRECPRRAERNGRVAGARINENVAFRIRSDAAHFTQIDVIGKRQRICRRIESDLWSSILSNDNEAD